ncbi:transglutaminase family protein [bacterium]|nr:transglutaminase family protein [bacterium]
MRYEIAHTLRLAAAAPVWEHHCELRLAPSPTPHQQVGEVALAVAPEAAVRRYRDGFGNTVHAFDLMAPHDAARVTLRAAVETTLANPFDFAPLPPGNERAWIAQALHGQPRLWDYLLHRSPLTPALATLELAVPDRDPGKPLLAALQAVMEWMRDALSREADAAPAPVLAQALRGEAIDALALGHLLVSIARAWGAPARIARGYRDPAYAEDDAEQVLHAWAEILVPGAGWRGIDPCTGLVTNDTYITVAVGRDAADCPPVRSACKGDETELARVSAVEVRGEQ